MQSHLVTLDPGRGCAGRGGTESIRCAIRMTGAMEKKVAGSLCDDANAGSWAAIFVMARRECA
jgi:hypothetical protein